MPTKLKLIISLLLFLGYPFIVYQGLDNGFPWLVPLGIAAILISRAASGIANPLCRYQVILAILFLLGALLIPSKTAKLLPVSAHLGLGALFLISLKNNSSLVERFVRLEYPVFPPGIVEYCRQVTWSWVCFFVFNAVVCAMIALSSSDAFWAFYNGVIVYIEMGLLFAGEYLYRQWRFPELEVPSPMHSMKSMITNGRHIWNDIYYF